MARIRQRKRSSLTSTLAVCATAYLLLAATALAAEWIPLLELAQAPAPQLAVLGVLLSGLLVLFRKAGQAAAVVTATLAFWFPIAPYLHKGDAESLAGEKETIKVALLETSNQAMVDYVLAAQPDIVAIADPSAAGRDRTAELAGVFPIRLDIAGPDGPIILARQGVVAELAASQSVTSFHLLRARIGFGASTFDLAVIHLDRPWPLGGGQGAAAQLTEQIAGETSRLIVLGDFNRTPWMNDLKRLQRALDISAGRTPASWPSWLAAPFRLPLDFVLVGRELSVRSAKLGPSLGSDHLPVIAEIGLKHVIAEAE
jgi:hypothetical protein